jgi:hypothetical protein
LDAPDTEIIHPYVAIPTIPAQFHSLFELETFIHELDGGDGEQTRICMAEEDFSTPPLPGSATIKPITDTAMLFDEGQQQQNCAADYYDHVLSSNAYFYQVHEPERATLMIVPAKKGWRIGELKAARNETVSADTANKVECWLSLANNGRLDQDILWD